MVGGRTGGIATLPKTTKTKSSTMKKLFLLLFVSTLAFPQKQKRNELKANLIFHVSHKIQITYERILNNN